MQGKIDKSTLVVRTAERMKEDILQNQWMEELPGYRSLSAHYQVSKNTIQASLKLLGQWSLLEPSEPGKHRKICKQSKRITNPVRKKQLLCISGNSALMNLGDFQLMQGLMNLWNLSEGDTVYVQLDYYRFKHPERKLEALIKEHRPDAILLEAPPGHWSDCAAAIKPSFFIGGFTTKKALATTIGSNMRNEIHRIVRGLHKKGHRRIMVVVPKSGQVLLRAITNGVADALHLSAQSVTAQDYVQVCHEDVPAVWKDFWQRSFMHFNPTAVVVINDVHWLSLQSYCYQNNIDIPGRLSVVSFNYNESFLWCDPQPSMVRFPEKKALAVFRRWINGGLLAMGLVDIETEYIEGGTVRELTQT